MNHRIDFDDEGRFVRITLSGPVSLERIEGLVGEMLGMPEFKKNLATLWDLREADVSTMSNDELRKMRSSREVLSEKRGHARVALVAERDLTFGVGRISEATAEIPGSPIMAFRDEDEALRWLIQG